MRAYRVTAALASGATVNKLAGSDAEARATRRSFMDQYGLKMADVIYDQVEVPTDKRGLIAYVNDLLGGVT